MKQTSVKNLMKETQDFSLVLIMLNWFQVMFGIGPKHTLELISSIQSTD